MDYARSFAHSDTILDFVKRPDIILRMITTVSQEPTGPSKLPIRARYLGHVTGFQPIRYQYFLVRSVLAEIMLLICVCK